MIGATVVLLLVDVALALHAVFAFLLGTICHARVYVRHQIRDKYFASQSESVTIRNGSHLRHTFSSFCRPRVNFAYTSLLAFAAASYICCKIVVHEAAQLAHKTWRIAKRHSCRHLLFPSCLQVGSLHTEAVKLKRRIPANKFLPQNVTVIVPTLFNIEDYRSSEVAALETIFTFLSLLKIKSVCMYSPLVEDQKLVKKVTSLAEKFGNVSCLFSAKESRSVMLDALSTR